MKGTWNGYNKVSGDASQYASVCKGLEKILLSTDRFVTGFRFEEL